MSAGSAYFLFVAHGGPQPGAFSNDHVKIITKSGEPLTFGEAMAFMYDGAVKPLYASSGVGPFEGLKDSQCQLLFGRSFAGVATGIIDTGLAVAKGTYAGAKILALNGDAATSSLPEVGIIAARNKKTAILLSCRGDGHLTSHPEGLHKIGMFLGVRLSSVYLAQSNVGEPTPVSLGE
jgi:hypothetical protein